MRHVKATTTAATLLGAFAVLAGCTNAGSPIFILQNQVPDEGCVISSSTSADFNPRGRIDVNAGAGYLFTPVVENVADQGDGAQGVVFVEGADIELTLEKGLLDAAVYDEAVSKNLIKFSKRFSGAIQPDGGTTSFAFTVIPDQLMTDYVAARLADDGSQLTEVKVGVSIFGNMNGGDVSTPTFNFWVDLCNGCMKQNVGACTDLSSGFEPLTGGECVTLQDVPLECCTATDSSEVCPAVAETPAE